MKLLSFALLIFLAAFILLIGCEKESLPGSIIPGDYSDMSISIYDTVFYGGYHALKNLDLDINRDGTPDIRFMSEIWGSPGMGQHPRSALMCLHENIRLHGTLTVDTLFLSSSSYTEVTQESITKIYSYRTFTYLRVDQSDSIITIFPEGFRLLPLNKGDKINNADVFATDSIPISSHYFCNMIYPVSIGQDSILYESQCSLNNRYTFPEEKIKYLGLQIEEEGNMRLGWIKLSVNDYYKIYLLETAIQEI